MWTVSRVWNMVQAILSIQNTRTTRMILEMKPSRFTISFWFMAQCRHCRRSLPLAIHRASMPGRLHDASIFCSPFMRIFGGTWGILSDFSFLFLLSCMKQRILKRETLVLSGELSLSNENSCSAKDSLKMLMKEAFHFRIVSSVFFQFFFQFIDGLPSGLQLPCAGRGASCPDETPAVEDICKVCPGCCRQCDGYRENRLKWIEMTSIPLLERLHRIRQKGCFEVSVGIYMLYSYTVYQFWRFLIQRISFKIPKDFCMLLYTACKSFGPPESDRWIPLG